MREILFVAAGGALGAVARYGVGIAAASLLGKGFPWGTLVVNVAGCFVMGLVIGWLMALESRAAIEPTRALALQLSLWKHGIAIGFLGGLTTFSSFGGDTLRAFEAGQTLPAFGNIAANVLLSLAAVACGAALMRAID